MALFDDVIRNDSELNSNFKGYVGNPPTTSQEYAAFTGWIDPTLAPSWATMQTEMHAVAVLNKRAKEYPTIASQLDMLWHAIDSGTLTKDSDFYKSIQQVKLDNPKA
jgi:hypothetical protein